MTLEEDSGRGERTRDEIVLAAHWLFLDHGYHGTSMRQIARKAGIAVGGIYNHFSSKEDIFTAVFLEHHPYHEILPAMNAARGETAAEFVRDAARRMVDALGERPDFLNLMFIELVEFKSQHIQHLFEIIYPRAIEEFGQRFLRYRGELRAIPVPILMRAFLGLFFSYVISELIIAGQLPPELKENALDRFIDIFLHGILIES